MNKPIAAVVVTYNRKVLLLECLDALLNQDHPLDALYVIDNASTDGTPELLRDREYMNNPKISYHRMETNLGGAGGFRNGLDVAFRDGHEWIWIMDDDAIPKADALMQMVPFLDSQGVCALANLKIDSEGEVQCSHLGKTTWNPLACDLIKPISPLEYESKDLVDIEFASFVGLLVNREAIQRVGFPKQEFFIHYDDFEYCLRLRRVGKIALVPNSVIIHKSPRPFHARKHVLFLSAVPQNIRSHCFQYYSNRNRTWTVKEYARIGYFGAIAWAIAHFARQVVKSTLFEHDNYLLRVYVLFKAHLDGLIDRFDNSFPSRVAKSMAAKPAQER